MPLKLLSVLLVPSSWAMVRKKLERKRLQRVAHEERRRLVELHVHRSDALVGEQALFDLANRAGETPLIIAVQQRHAPVVKRLLEADADADRKDNATGRSARDYAGLDRRNPELLKLLETVKPAKAKSAAGPKL